MDEGGSGGTEYTPFPLLPWQGGEGRRCRKSEIKCREMMRNGGPGGLMEGARGNGRQKSGKHKRKTEVDGSRKIKGKNEGKRRDVEDSM